jgi:hypothetical protein
MNLESRISKTVIINDCIIFRLGYLLKTACSRVFCYKGREHFSEKAMLTKLQSCLDIIENNYFNQDQLACYRYYHQTKSYILITTAVTKSRERAVTVLLLWVHVLNVPFLERT